MGPQGNREGLTASPSLAFKDILFCPPQDVLFRLQQCQRLLTPRAALLARLGSLRPRGACLRWAPAIDPAHPGQTPGHRSHRAARVKGWGGPAWPRHPQQRGAAGHAQGGPRAAEVALGCGIPSRNTKGQRWGGWRGIFLPERPRRIVSAPGEWSRRKAAPVGSARLGDGGTGAGLWASSVTRAPCSPAWGQGDGGWKTRGQPQCDHCPYLSSSAPAPPASWSGDQGIRGGDGPAAGPSFPAACPRGAGSPLCLLAGLP